MSEKVYSHGGWLKLNVAVDVKTSQMATFSLTETRIHDNKVALVEEVAQASEMEGKRVKRVFADKG